MEINQTSFAGGMNLLVDDTRIQPNEYREAFNVRNRFDILDQLPLAIKLEGAPIGPKQGLYTFGDYLLLFVFGQAWYQFRGAQGWNLIQGFNMDKLVTRYYIETVPVSTSPYGRAGVVPSGGAVAQPNGGINLVNVSLAFGNPAGIIIQDGINQPQFIWVDVTGIHCRVTQNFSQWTYDPTGKNDRREYVPIGTFMAWMDGVLFVLAPDGATLLRSCSGRPLDFVINVDLNGNKGGDASTTAYSVGTGGITCLKALPSGGLFVSAAGVICYAVTFNRTPGAPTMFGEPTFIRQVLFTAGCMSDRTIVDILGDTAFVDPEGLRSFNSVLQTQNEGRNSIFSLKIAKLFKGIIQDGSTTAAIIFDNYALFGVNTIYGYVIIAYDTLNKCFSSIDTQLGGVAVRQFAKIDTNVTQLYCIGTDDNVYQLYAGTEFATSTIRFGSICSQNPKQELKPNEFRCILNGFKQDSVVTARAFVNNRVSGDVLSRTAEFVTPVNPYAVTPSLADVDTQVTNFFFNFTSANQGWKVFFLLTWTGGGSITNVQTTVGDLTTINPLMAQAVMK